MPVAVAVTLWCRVLCCARVGCCARSVVGARCAVSAGAGGTVPSALSCARVAFRVRSGVCCAAHCCVGTRCVCWRAGNKVLFFCRWVCITGGSTSILLFLLLVPVECFIIITGSILAREPVVAVLVLWRCRVLSPVCFPTVRCLACSCSLLSDQSDHFYSILAHSYFLPIS